MARKAIVVGASSGIGRELAKVFSENGWEVGLTGRRTARLEELASGLATRSYVKAMDVKDTDAATRALETLIGEMGGLDVLVLNAGAGHINPSLDWALEKESIDTNVSGFTALAAAGMRYFIGRGAGHLVGVSSIAGIRGNDWAPAYSASKAFISNYLEGLSRKAAKANRSIAVTDIQPGFVDTDMAKGDHLFWVASPQKAARQIYAAIVRKRGKAYITRRWRLMAWLLKLLPRFIYERI
jgi:short-subunit dehydrogenase